MDTLKTSDELLEEFFVDKLQQLESSQVAGLMTKLYQVNKLTSENILAQLKKKKSDDEQDKV